MAFWVALLGATTAPAQLPEEQPPKEQPPKEQPPKEQPAKEQPPEELEGEIPLEKLLTTPVVSPTKVAQRTSETPAVVTVITSEEIRGRAYNTLAEVLRSVPGFYDVYDLVTHNVGVRGINGGHRASGNVIKLMIDGVSVDYRQTTGNFFGEELIPLEAVDRIEIIRGPLSALYGANAFLGVINVITKSGVEALRNEVTGQGNMVHKNLGWGASFMVGGSGSEVEALVAARTVDINRSGLKLPQSSPQLHRLVFPPPAVPFQDRGVSMDDLNRSKSVFGKLSLLNLGAGRLTLSASVQNLDAVGEFLDLGTLYHGTRVALLNQNYRALYEREPSEKVALKFSGQYYAGAPTPVAHLDIGQPGAVFLSNSGVQGWRLAAEVRLLPVKSLTLTAGGDAEVEHYLLLTYDQLLRQDVLAPDGSVLRPKGTITPGPAHGARRTFQNFGAFSQGIFTFGRGWSTTAGVRLDAHNIYGLNPSARLALVWAPQQKPLSFKALYGSSFKAPSAIQLYAQPVAVGDAQGNPNLKAQLAHTVELASGYKLPGTLGELTLNVFATNVRRRVEFVLRGSFSQAQNILNEWLTGGEFDGRIRLSKLFHLRSGLGVAAHVSRFDAGLLAGLPRTTQPLYPVVQAHLIGDCFLPWFNLWLSGEVSYIGKRTSSQANAVIQGSAYDLPAYVFTAVALTLPGKKLFGNLDTRASFRVTDLINWQWVEPGFGGIDVPTQGRSFFLTLTQSL